MMIFMVLLIFLYGISIGSFLNVLIYRIPKKENPARGRSYCPSCRTTIRWYDLFPILSYVLLRGRCRYCGAKISLQYPVVESVTGIGFVLLFYLIGLNYQFLAALVLWIGLVVVAGIFYNKMISYFAIG